MPAAAGSHLDLLEHARALAAHTQALHGGSDAADVDHLHQRLCALRNALVEHVHAEQKDLESLPPARDRTATRVADAHHEARRTLAASAGFALAAPVAAVVPHDTGSWLPLHLLLVGALLCAISGATQLLAVTWSTAPAPPARTAAAQRWAVVLGTVGVAGGRELGVDAVTGTGAVLVAAGLALLAAMLAGVRRSSRTDRFRPAIDTYLAALGCGVVGVVLGAVIAGSSAGEWWPRIRGAHLTLNVFGLVGLVIAGTLPYFVATQARTKMHRRATARRVRTSGAALVAALAVAVVGELADHGAVVAVGLLGYAAGLVAVLATLPVPKRRQLDWAGPRLLQLGAGMTWWLAMTVVLAVAALDDHDAGPVLRALAVGGYAQILIASLAYFGPVLRGGGHERLSAGFTITRSWVGLAAANAAAAGLLADQRTVAGVALTAWALDTAVRAVRLGVGVRAS